MAICIDGGDKRADLPEFNDGPCPHCKGPTEIGHGLAGGGYGIYSYCDNCQKVVSKTVEPNED